MKAKSLTEAERNLLEGYFQVIRSKYELQDSLERRDVIRTTLEGLVSSLIRRDRVAMSVTHEYVRTIPWSGIEDKGTEPILSDYIAKRIKEEALAQEISSKKYDHKTVKKLLEISGLRHKCIAEIAGCSRWLIDKYLCGQNIPKPHQRYGLAFLVFLRDTFGYNPYNLEISQTELQKMKNKEHLQTRKRGRKKEQE